MVCPVLGARGGHFVSAAATPAALAELESTIDRLEDEKWELRSALEDVNGTVRRLTIQATGEPASSMGAVTMRDPALISEINTLKERVEEQKNKLSELASLKRLTEQHKLELAELGALKLLDQQRKQELADSQASMQLIEKELNELKPLKAGVTKLKEEHDAALSIVNEQLRESQQQLQQARSATEQLEAEVSIAKVHPATALATNMFAQLLWCGTSARIALIWLCTTFGALNLPTGPQAQLTDSTSMVSEKVKARADNAARERDEANDQAEEYKRKLRSLEQDTAVKIATLKVSFKLCT